MLKLLTLVNWGYNPKFQQEITNQLPQWHGFWCQHRTRAIKKNTDLGGIISPSATILKKNVWNCPWSSNWWFTFSLGHQKLALEFHSLTWFKICDFTWKHYGNRCLFRPTEFPTDASFAADFSSPYIAWESLKRLQQPFERDFLIASPISRGPTDNWDIHGRYHSTSMDTTTRGMTLQVNHRNHSYPQVNG